MYLLYTDASGTVEQKDVSDHYVLLGLCVHELSWSNFEQQILALKAPYELPGTPLELHAKDLCAFIREQDKIPGFQGLGFQERRKAVLSEKAKSDSKRSRYSDSCIHLTRDERNEVYASTLDLVASFESLSLFVEIVNKEDYYKYETELLAHSFSQIVSRFDRHIKRVSEKDRGLMVMDSEPEKERDFCALFSHYRAQGHPWGRVARVIENPFFVDSKLSLGTQVADICAYAVRRYIDYGRAPGSHEEQNFKKIFLKFDNDGHQLHGARHYRQKWQTCDCLICMARVSFTQRM